MTKICWTGGAAWLRLTPTGRARCDWGYCGGGPIYRDVPLTHFVNAIESLLGWDHPAAHEACAYVKAVS